MVAYENFNKVTYQNSFANFSFPQHNNSLHKLVEDEQAIAGEEVISAQSTNQQLG